MERAAPERRRISFENCTGDDRIEFSLCDTTFVSLNLVSVLGLKISTCCLAMNARFNLRRSSSVFPENIDPQMTSIQPVFLSGPLPRCGSINI